MNAANIATKGTDIHFSGSVVHLENLVRKSKTIPTWHMVANLEEQ